MICLLKTVLLSYTYFSVGYSDSLSTFRNLLKKRGISRESTTAFQRSFHWIEEVKSLIRSDLTYDQILNYLLTNKNIAISKSTLQSILKRHNIRKQEPDVDAELVEYMVANEIQGVGQHLGYRTMTLALRQKYNLNISRDLVANAQRAVCPDLVRMRKGRKLKRRLYQVKGPMHVWHYDGYDKLARFGFGIHGCVDGYSRKIIWLKVAASNRLSQVVLDYYLKATLQNGVPCKTRSDKGSENILAATVQAHVRGDTDAHIFGASTRNQRIESFWGRLRFNAFQYWIEYFNLLEDENLFDRENEWDLTVSTFVHGDLIERDLKQFTEIWNGHRIRKNVHSNSPAGVPNFLFLTQEDRFPRIDIGDNYQLAVQTFGVIDQLDPFGINHVKELLSSALAEVGIRTITNENMKQCYLLLRGLQN